MLAPFALFGLLQLAAGVRQTASEAFQGSIDSQPQPPGIKVPPKKQLKIFASTFNAKNRDFGLAKGKEVREKWEDMLDVVLEGHGEADLLLLGFQEIRDNGYSMGSYMRKSVLFTQPSLENFKKLKAEIQELASAPEAVHKVHKSLTKELKSFHANMRSRLDAFRTEFGTDKTGFHKHLAKESPAAEFIKTATAMQESARLPLISRLSSFKMFQTSADRRQFENMTVAATLLAASMAEYPQRSIKAKLGKIRTWSENVAAKIQEAQSKYPNLIFTTAGQEKWLALLKAFNRIKPLEYQILFNSKIKQKGVEDGVRHFVRSVKDDVKREEDKVIHQVLKDWERLNTDFEVFQKDLQAGLAVKQELPAMVASAATEAAAEKGRQLESVLREWARSDERLEDMLGQIAATPGLADLAHELVDIQMEVQKYDSGFTCEFVNHHDTMLYTYVNPWSSWEIAPVEYSNPGTCEKRSVGSQKNLGCNIDNNKKGECGKVVNLMVFDAKKEDAKIRICGLNTHMSFAGKASDRLSYITAAMEETERAECDTVIFTGDFNSRLHCDSGGKSPVPAFDMSETDASSSFDFVLNTFCKGDRCALQGSPHAHYDEMAQMLTEERVVCFEQFERGSFTRKKYWDKVSTQNALLRWGVHEAGTPNFAPTYKLEDPGRASAVAEGWKRCLRDEPTCFANEDSAGKHSPKHNPAWTDRILLWARHGAVQLSTREYARRAIRGTFYDRSDHGAAAFSDHAAVVARVTATTA